MNSNSKIRDEIISYKEQVENSSEVQIEGEAINLRSSMLFFTRTKTGKKISLNFLPIQA